MNNAKNARIWSRQIHGLTVWKYAVTAEDGRVYTYNLAAANEDEAADWVRMSFGVEPRRPFFPAKPSAWPTP